MNQQSSMDTVPSGLDGTDAISRRAYELWENAGRPDGDHLRHWLQAEQELKRGVASPVKDAIQGDGAPVAVAVENNLESRQSDSARRSTDKSGRDSRGPTRPPKRTSSTPFESAQNGPSSHNPSTPRPRSNTNNPAR